MRGTDQLINDSVRSNLSGEINSNILAQIKTFCLFKAVHMSFTQVPSVKRIALLS